MPAMPHDHSPETVEALKKKVPVYRGMTDREIHMNMMGMGPDYEWRVSGDSVKGPVGVLLLTHGVGETGDRILKKTLEPVGRKYPTSVGYGMAMTSSGHYQSAVDHLVAQGAKTIYLVPTVTTPYNSLYRQWEYIFGMGRESAYVAVPKVQAKAKLVMTPAFNDSAMVSDIMLDYARELSKDPKNEVLILVAHGPEEPADNVPDLASLQRHADRIRKTGGFADVLAINIQDDAIKPIRQGNVTKLRKMITDAKAGGKRVLVVPCVLASHGIQATLRQDLRGLDYAFQEKGMSESPKFTQWVLESLAAAQKGAPAQPGAKG
jgi:sirohydrochlorin ferrochelatase